LKQKDYAHIKLEVLDVVHIVAFLDQINDYQRKNNAQIPWPSSLLSKEIQEDLVDRINLSLTKEALDRMSLAALIKRLQVTVQPKSVDKFYKLLEMHVDFKMEGHFYPSVTKFPKFREALLRFRGDFTLMFDFISESNDPDMIPDLDNKSEGLIRLFLDKIPFRYGHKLYKQIKPKQFADMHQFMEKFYALARKDFNSMEKAGHVLERFEKPTKGTATVDKLSSITAPTPESRDAFAPPVSIETLRIDDDIEFEQGLNAMIANSSIAKPKERFGCWRMVFTGKCDKANCTSKHDPKSVEEARAWYKGQLFKPPQDNRVRGVQKVQSIVERPVHDEDESDEDYA